jgi:hypothetical protein
MSLRRLRVLVQNLPAESATARAVIGHDWTPEALLLADLVDVVRFLRAEWLMAHEANPDRPEPIPRPGVTTAQDRRAAQRAAHDHVMSQLHTRGVSDVVEGRQPLR